jgi:hypothetical protein
MLAAQKGLLCDVQHACLVFLAFVTLPASAAGRVLAAKGL